MLLSYGDWLIMNNKNNLSCMVAGKERREPFSFSLEELPSEFDKVQITSLYRAEFQSLENDEFLKQVYDLIFTHV